MPNTPRTRLRMDLPEHVIRAVHVRAGLSGQAPRQVVVTALEDYLRDQIEMISRHGTDTPADGAEPAHRHGKRSD